MNRLFRAVALAAVLPISVACEPGGSKNAATSGPLPANPAPTASTPTPAATPLTRAQFQAALLTRADLPPGFKKSKHGGGESDDDFKVKAPHRQCEELFEQTGQRRKDLDGSLSEAEVDYENGSNRSR